MIDSLNYHVAPYVPKVDISLIVLEWSDLQANALRGVLEDFGYRVQIHWIGSRVEFEKILKGEIASHDFWIICNHGDEELGMYTCPDEAPISGDEIGDIANLEGKMILSTGCFTGIENIVNGFKKAGCEIYLAPKDAPYGNAALLFSIHTCYEHIQNKVSIRDAGLLAKQYNQESEVFEVFNFS